MLEWHWLCCEKVVNVIARGGPKAENHHLALASPPKQSQPRAVGGEIASPPASGRCANGGDCWWSSPPSRFGLPPPRNDSLSQCHSTMLGSWQIKNGRQQPAIFALFDYRFLVATTTTNGNQQPQDEDKQVDVGQVHRQGSG